MDVSFIFIYFFSILMVAFFHLQLKKMICDTLEYINILFANKLLLM